MVTQIQTVNGYTPSLREIVSIVGDKPTLEMIRAGDVFIDESYQRTIKPGHLRKIVAEFDWTLFFAIGVSQREDGTYAVFDGQHRVQAVVMSFGPDELVPAIVVRGMTAEDEARLFYAMQVKRAPVSPMERFKAQIFRGEPGALDIVQIARNHGFTIGNSDGGSNLQSISTIEEIYYPTGRTNDERDEGFGERWKGGERLDWVLSIAERSWRHQEHVTAQTLRSISKFFLQSRRIHGGLDDARLVRVLSMHSPAAWESRARDKRIAPFVLMADNYNSRLSTGRRVNVD